MPEGAHRLKAVDHSIEAQRFRRARCRCSEKGSDCGVPSTAPRSNRLRAGAAGFDEERLVGGGAAAGFEDVFDGDVVALPGPAAALGWPGWDAVLGFGIESRVGARSMRPMNQRHWQTWDLCQRSSLSARGPCRRGDPPYPALRRRSSVPPSVHLHAGRVRNTSKRSRRASDNRH